MTNTSIIVQRLATAALEQARARRALTQRTGGEAMSGEDGYNEELEQERNKERDDLRAALRWEHTAHSIVARVSKPPHGRSCNVCRILDWRVGARGKRLTG